MFSSIKMKQQQQQQNALGFGIATWLGGYLENSTLKIQNKKTRSPSVKQ